MKFVAVRTIGDAITEGKIYFGSFVFIPEKSTATSNKGDLKIVVFNDKGYWSKYHPSYFEPA